MLEGLGRSLTFCGCGLPPLLIRVSHQCVSQEWISIPTVLYIVVGGIRRVYFNPLSKFPGSKLAALTLWYEFYCDLVKRGTHIWPIEKMHKKYGPIIRLNPYQIHILDPDFFDELYSAEKYPWCLNTAGAGGSTFSAVTHEHHRLRHSPLAPFFSARSVAKVEKLCSPFCQLAQTGMVVRLDATLIALTMDVICDYAFDDDLCYLDKHDFEANWKDSVVKAADGGAAARQFPSMLPLMERVPLHPKETGNKERRTIFHILRDCDLPRKEKAVKRLCDEAGVIIGSRWRRACCLERARVELDTVLREEGELPTWTVLQGLPYFRRGQRGLYGITVRNPRIAREDIRYKDYTPVSQSAYFILMHPDIFPQPIEFRPERWLQPGKRLDRYLISFGKGTRQCLGIKQLHLALAAIVSLYDWEMYETGLDDVVCKHDFFISVADLKSKGVRPRITASRY
ncbi:cytochrome P450 monooxygenase sdnE [Rhypophila sp. PSN 637]